MDRVARSGFQEGSVRGEVSAPRRSVPCRGVDDSTASVLERRRVRQVLPPRPLHWWSMKPTLMDAGVLAAGLAVGAGAAVAVQTFAPSARHARLRERLRREAANLAPAGHGRRNDDGNTRNRGSHRRGQHRWLASRGYESRRAAERAGTAVAIADHRRRSAAGTAAQQPIGIGDRARTGWPRTRTPSCWATGE